MALSAVSGYPTVCATISCVYCKAVLSFQGLPAVRYADHLSNEHRILFEQVSLSGLMLFDKVLTLGQKFPIRIPKIQWKEILQIYSPTQL